MENEAHAIGMMDSGIGGLTVVKAAKALLPNESIVFVGDNARNPYGPKDPEEVIKYSRQIAHYLVEKHQIKVLAIACNTATACALPVLQDELDIPVIGVIDSGAKAAVEASRSKRIGLIATQGTVRSNKYQQGIAALDKNAKVFAQAEPDFVQLVEQNRYQEPAAEAEVADHLAAFRNDQIDTLILGCTHFPLLTSAIKKAVGNDVTLIDAGAVTALELAADLKVNGLLRKTDTKKPSYQLYTTGSVASFETIARNWLGQGDWQFSHLPLATLTKEE
ncbi:glutamate racemase [Fructobacillus sp. M1-13]|uniref:Glutamate racemase n=1 Tax=Fructobacillus papyriferae TaxID=2713171 RepID=A0ABS5QN07_9LACO|nr:glutamate racemase [Fructobacillus papyriferae]MBS9334458.1 glutamate racemase [Fructobacillus papyriferae]MCD2158447.1 glutamate racemase [Fructobacillus papyriferae]